ncbi:MAG: hypothetical protein FJ037_09995 [Chloroflexi bacterium]|nr:hypothetical protein [Chloroflexota bacterium]
MSAPAPDQHQPHVEWFLYPTQGADEAHIIDHAFKVLSYMATPVFELVCAVLVVAVLRFRSKGEPVGDGADLRGEGAVPGKLLSPAKRRRAVFTLQYQFSVSERRACLVVSSYSPA